MIMSWASINHRHAPARCRSAFGLDREQAGAPAAAHPRITRNVAEQTRKTRTEKKPLRVIIARAWPAPSPADFLVEVRMHISGPPDSPSTTPADWVGWRRRRI